MEALFLMTPQHYHAALGGLGHSKFCQMAALFFEFVSIKVQ